MCYYTHMEQEKSNTINFKAWSNYKGPKYQCADVSLSTQSLVILSKDNDESLTIALKEISKVNFTPGWVSVNYFRDGKDFKVTLGLVNRKELKKLLLSALLSFGLLSVRLFSKSNSEALLEQSIKDLFNSANVATSGRTEMNATMKLLKIVVASYLVTALVVLAGITYFVVLK